MAFTQVMGGGGNFRKWADWVQGDSVTGVISARTPDSYGNMSVVIKVEEAQFTANPPAVGSQFTLNYCGAFRMVEEKLNLGIRIKVIFQGRGIQSKGKFKGKEMNLVDVFIDEEEGEVVPAADDVADTSGL